MKNNVIYYPYIRIPESDWLTRMLLYWDQVGAIIPSDFVREPEKLGEHTRNLVEAELVYQILPGEYTYKIPGFEESFVSYLDSLGPVMEHRRDNFRRGQTVKVHIEKLDRLAIDLESLGIGKSDYVWCEVDVDTAHDFMAYLATVLGQLEDVQAIPITDQDQGLSPFMRLQSDHFDIEKDLESLRLTVLEDVLPGPMQPLDPVRIRRFKDRHGEALRKFRLKIEKEITEIAAFSEPYLRSRRLDILKTELSEETHQIRQWMNEHQFGQLNSGKFIGVALAIPGAPPLVGLVCALYGLLHSNEPSSSPLQSPFAYAAYAQREVLRRP